MPKRRHQRAFESYIESPASVTQLLPRDQTREPVWHGHFALVGARVTLCKRRVDDPALTRVDPARIGMQRAVMCTKCRDRRYVPYRRTSRVIVIIGVAAILAAVGVHLADSVGRPAVRHHAAAAMTTTTTVPLSAFSFPTFTGCGPFGVSRCHGTPPALGSPASKRAYTRYTWYLLGWNCGANGCAEHKPVQPVPRGWTDCGPKGFSPCG